MTCQQCGEPTTRPTLCKDCARDRRREADLQDIDSDGELLAYECQQCGRTYEREGLGPCPDCEETRAVCLGPAAEVSA